LRLGDDLSHGTLGQAAAGDVEESETRLRPSFGVVEASPEELEPGTDGEAGPSGEDRVRALVGQQGTSREELRRVLAAAEQVDVTVSWNGLVDRDLDDAGSQAACGRAVGQSQGVASITVGTEQIRVDLDDAELIRHDVPP
jgi:hypothetical protein